MLVKQLKKELNITKSMKEEHRRVGEFKCIYTKQAGTYVLYM